MLSQSSTEGFLPTPAQAQLWRRHLEGCPHVCQLSARIGTHLEPKRIEAAFRTVLQHHEIMRTAYRDIPGINQPLQVIETDILVDVRYTDLSTLSRVECLSAAATLKSAAIDKIIIWAASGPRGLVDVLAFDGAESLLVLTLPRIMADEASLPLVVEEALATYAASATDEHEEAIQFIDYSEWFNEQRKNASPEDAQSFLNDAIHLAYPDVSPWSSEVRRDPRERAGSGANKDCVVAVLDAALQLEVEAVADKYSVRKDALLLLVWSLCIGRVGGRWAFKLDNYFSGRPFEELMNVPGPFAEFRTIPIVLDRSETITKSVEKISDTLNKMEDLWPFLGNQKGAQIEECDAVAFSFRSEPSSITTGGLSAADIEIDVMGERRALCQTVLWGSEQVRLKLSYDRSYCDQTVAERLMELTLFLLKQIVLAPEQPLSAFKMTTASEDRLIADECGAGVSAIDTNTCIHHEVERRAAEYPDATAVVSAEGEMSFAELNARANRVAHALARNGVGRGDRVAIIMRRSADPIVAIVGTLKVGACYVPIDADWPPSRIQQLVSAVRASAILADASLEPGLRQHILQGPVTLLTLQETAAEPDANYSAAVDPADPAYIIFTSGSTGTPKGVVVRHGSVVNLVKAIHSRIYGSPPNALRVAVNAPMVFDASVKQIFQLVNGHCLCIIGDDVRRDVQSLLSFLRVRKVDVFDCTPSHLQALQLASAGDWTFFPPIVLIGGEAISKSLWHELSAVPTTRFFNVYGPTEATVDATFAPIRGEDPPNIGRPLPGVAAYIVDDSLKLVPPGEPGELCIAGAGVATGYFEDPARTADRFVEDPFRSEAGARMYRSGDVVRMLPGGQITFVGRGDDQVKLRGYRIELGEIEGVLCEHPTVRQATVTIQEDEAGDQALVAYVVLTGPGPREKSLGNLRRPDGREIAQMNWVETQYLREEIFEKKVYLQEGIQIPDDACVFDVGANIGMFSLFVDAHAVRPRIFAFEPLAPIRERLIANVSNMDGRIEVFDCGLSSREHSEEFTLYPNYSMMSSSTSYADADAERAVIKRSLENEHEDGVAGRAEILNNIDAVLQDRFKTEHHICRLRRMSDVIREQSVDRIDLLKIDVQRAELDVLEGIEEHDWPKIKQIVAEIHDAPGTPTEGRVGIISDLLERQGFEIRIHQEPSLRGTDRFNIYAWRPDYRAAASQRAAAGTLDENAVPLDRYLESRLPDYMVPQVIVELDTLPLNKNGKIDRKALPKPSAWKSERNNDLIEPATDAERILLDVWSQVLGARSVGVTDNFFDLGGDSIRSIRVQVLAKDRGINFTIHDLFTYQTIRSLLQALGDREKIEPDRASRQSIRLPVPFELISPTDRERLPPNVENVFPLSTLQSGMVYHAELTNQPATYHNATSYRVKAAFDEVGFRSCLGDLMESHPVLRSGFSLGEFSEPVQIVYRQVPLPLTIFDVTSCDEGEQEAAISAAISRELDTFFDFAQPPLFRILVHLRGTAEFQITVAEFHAILDGLSLHLMVTELFARYGAHLGLSAKFQQPPPGVGFDAFVAVERDDAKSGEGKRFWTEMLSGVRPFLLREPSRRKGSRAKSMRRTEWQVPATVHAALQAHAKSFSIPLKHLLLAVHVQSLRGFSGRNDLVTGLVTNGRPEVADGERVLGLFINTVPLRIRDTGVASTWLEVARSALEAETAMLPHRRVPLANIQRWTGDQLLFDVFFNFTQFEAGEWRSIIGSLGVVETRHIATDIDFGLAVDFEVDVDTQTLSLVYQYDANSLSPGEMENLMNFYRRSLEAMAKDPERSASAVREPIRQSQGDISDGDSASIRMREHGSFRSPEAGVTIEARLTGIWADVLGLERVDRESCFGDLGGHSLLAVQALARIRAETKVALSLSEFLQNPTLAQLSALISTKMDSGSHDRK